MKLTKCTSCGGDVVDGSQKHHHLKMCVEYKEEGRDYVVCKVCGYRSPQLPKHLKIHGLDTRSYREKFGDVPVFTRGLVEKRNRANIGTHVKPISERSDSILCDKCGGYYLQRFARRHLEKCVPANLDKYQEGRDYVSCPECKCPLLRLGQHLRLKHGWTNDRIQMEVNKGLKLMADRVVEKWAEKVDFKEAQNKREATHLARHGHANPFSDPSVQEKIAKTNRSRYGVDYPMQNEGVRLRQNESAHNGPSGQEVFFDEHTCENVVFCGCGSRYIRTKLGVRKYGRVIKDLNPDFLILPDNVLESARNCLRDGKPFDRQKHRTRYVVELLGDWYHSEEMIGVPSDEHEKEIVEAYASAGIECLVLWEKDVLGRWDQIELMVSEWIDRAVSDMNERPVYRRSTKGKVDKRKGSLVCPYGSGKMFKTEKSLKRWVENPKNYWRPGLEDGRDYVVCGECGVRVAKLTEHLRKSHGILKGDYLEKYPGSRLVAGVVSDAVAESCRENPRRANKVAL